MLPWKKPPAQGGQLAEPLPAANAPALQLEHEADPAEEYWPAAQGLDPKPLWPVAGQEKPAGQAKQSAAPVPAWYAPTLQLAQSCAAEAE